jgi:hypothetical protein
MDWIWAILTHLTLKTTIQQNIIYSVGIFESLIGQNVTCSSAISITFEFLEYIPLSIMKGNTSIILNKNFLNKEAVVQRMYTAWASISPFNFPRARGWANAVK